MRHSTRLTLECFFVRTLFLFPLRLCVGWGLSPRLLGFIGATMLVLLRLSIGWHFYSEGVDKYKTGDWSAAPFFANAKGPLAEHYRGMVWDHDGATRLDIEQSMLPLAIFRDQVAAHYGFDAKQTEQAQKNYAAAIEDQKLLYQDWEQEINEFRLGIERIRKLDADPMREGVESMQGQRETIRRENAALIRPVFAVIDQHWANYAQTQNDLATTEQRSARGTLEFRQPLAMDTSTIDRIIPYFDIAIGLCLLLGLFTPLAALAAAVFLGSVFLSQYPPGTGPTSSNYQLIESMACLVLAGTAAGRFAGLDYFLHLIVRKAYGGTASG